MGTKGSGSSAQGFFRQSHDRGKENTGESPDQAPASRKERHPGGWKGVGVKLCRTKGTTAMCILQR